MAPMAWIRRIAQELPVLTEVPLFGNAPPFNWHQFSSLLSGRFSTSISIRAKDQAWRDAHETKRGLGTDGIQLPIALAPIGTVFWFMSHEDVSKLTTFLMKPNSKGRGITSEILQEGFFRYLVLEALDAVQNETPFQELTLNLSEDEGPTGPVFSVDVEIEVDGKSCWGRLAIPTEFKTAWVQHFSAMPSEYIPSERAKQTPLVMGVQTGRVLLPRNELEKIEAGDFILLDRGSYDAEHQTGTAMLMLETTPLFNVKIKQNKIELVDYAFYYEETMEHKGEPHHHHEEKFPSEEGEAVALKETPIMVTVEIARLKITLDQLMQLNPGNVLELPIHPDQGVSLSVNGQKVGRGELVHLGEQLGVRILEI